MQQIIAIGGGGCYSPAEVALNKYVADQCPAAEPKVCLLGQAGGEHPHWAKVFTDSFSALGCVSNHLSLFFPHTSDIEDFLRSQDVIFVGGGNTKSMLALWREWGIDLVLRQAWQDGVVLAGVSAGAQEYVRIRNRNIATCAKMSRPETEDRTSAVGHTNEPI